MEQEITETNQNKHIPLYKDGLLVKHLSYDEVVKLLGSDKEAMLQLLKNNGKIILQ